MSLEVLLIPIGIAAIAALKEARSTDLCEKCKATRIVEVDVLHEALPLIGATVTDATADRVTAASRWGSLTFQKVGGLFLGRVDESPGSATNEMLAELDGIVGRVMQNRTAQSVIERARELGFHLVERHDEDGSLNYVFEEAT